MLAQDMQLSAKRTLIKPGAWRFVAAACSIVFGFCALIVFTHILNPADFGTYTFVLWLATVTTPAVGIGMSTRTCQRLAEIQSREQPRAAAGVFYFVWRKQYRTILLYCVVYLLAAFALAWFFQAAAPLYFLLLAGLTVPPALLAGVSGITLRSLRRFDLLTMISVIGTCTTLLLAIMVTQIEHEQVALLLLISAAVSLLMLILELVCIVRLLPLKEARLPGPLLQDRLTRGLSNSPVLFMLDAIVWQPGEVLLLAHWQGSAQVAFYALSSIVCVRVMEAVSMLLTTTILPLLLRYVPGQHYTSAADAFVKTSRFMTLLAVPTCMCMMYFCPTIIATCFGAAYLPAVMPVRILLVSAALGSIATVSLTYLASGERRRAQLWLGVLSATLNVALALPAVMYWGATGAALASALAQFVSATGSIIICVRLVNVKR